jgi:restriction system protein
MYGVMTAEGANGVIIMTSGLFTQEAKTFAENKPVDLVEGNQLVDLVRAAQGKPIPSVAEADITDETQMICEKCGADMVVRTARRGKNAGGKFWGCSSFPKCTFTKTYTG